MVWAMVAHVAAAAVFRQQWQREWRREKRNVCNQADRRLLLGGYGRMENNNYAKF